MVSDKRLLNFLLVQERPLSEGHLKRDLNIVGSSLFKPMWEVCLSREANTKALRTSGITPVCEQERNYKMHKTSQPSAGTTHPRKARGEVGKLKRQRNA